MSSNARFSTYSGAPSLQPSLAPTWDTSSTSNRSNRSSTQQGIHSSTTTTTTNPRRTSLAPNQILSEKNTHLSSGITANGIYANPAALASSSTLSSSDPKSADIKSWSGALERMQDERLDKQRYVMSGNKSEEVSKLALGAKVERALARRMVGQDAQFTPKMRARHGMPQEKRSLEIQAN